MPTRVLPASHYQSSFDRDIICILHQLLVELRRTLSIDRIQRFTHMVVLVGSDVIRHRCAEQLAS